MLSRSHSNDAAAQNTIKEVADTLNPQATCHFIKADVSLLKSVDTACAEIKSKEDRVNLLFITCGVLTLGGRNGTLIPSSLFEHPP